MANQDGSISYTLGGKLIVIPYVKIKTPETTNRGKIGKWTPFGFVEKPGEVGVRKKIKTPEPAIESAVERDDDPYIGWGGEGKKKKKDKDK